MRGKVDNALNFLFGQFRARLQAQHNRRRGGLFLFFVEAVLRQHDVYARLFNGIDLLNGSRQFALQRLEIVDTILKLGHTEFTVVKDLKPLVSARKPLCGEIEARLMDIRRRHKNGRPILAVLHLIADLRFTQLIGDLARILGLHIGKERHHIRFAAIPKTESKDECKNRECGAKHDIALALVKAFPHGKAALFPLSHNLFPFKSSWMYFPFPHAGAAA